MNRLCEGICEYVRSFSKRLYDECEKECNKILKRCNKTDDYETCVELRLRWWLENYKHVVTVKIPLNILMDIDMIVREKYSNRSQVIIMALKDYIRRSKALVRTRRLVIYP